MNNKHKRNSLTEYQRLIQNLAFGNSPLRWDGGIQVLALSHRSCEVRGRTLFVFYRAI